MAVNRFWLDRAVWTSTPYDELRAGFGWNLPEFFNITAHITDVAEHVGRSAPAVDVVEDDGSTTTYTYSELLSVAARLANGLTDLAITRGDRVAILLNQRFETLASHLAVYALGAIAVPMSVQMGEDSLSHRLANSGARAVLTEAGCLARLGRSVSGTDVEFVVAIDGGSAAEFGGEATRLVDWERALSDSDQIVPADTKATDPALICYTSGTTGTAKGAVHGHRVLPAHLISLQLAYGFPAVGAGTYWTPVDWAWLGGSFDLAIPALAMGGRVLARGLRRFDAQECLKLLERYAVNYAFLPPTALRMLSNLEDIPSTFALVLKAILSGGEAFSDDLIAWAGSAFPGVQLNELFGQTEMNLLVGTAGSVLARLPGATGRPFPGHDVRVVGADGPVGVGEIGEAVAAVDGDPAAFLYYWGNPEQTSRKIRDGLLYTGDLVKLREGGYLQYVSRDDDVIISSGYRIGPAEIENVIASVPGVADVAVIATEDAVRGQLVSAFVVSTGTIEPEKLSSLIGDAVRARVAGYARPRRVEFVTDLPKTVTGKVSRPMLRARVKTQES